MEKAAPQSQVAPINSDRTAQHAPARFGVIDLALVAMTLIWGTNFVVIKASLTQFAPFAFMALRFAIAGSLLLLVLYLREHSLRLERRDYVRVAVLGLIGTTAYQPLFISALSLTTASNAAIIVASAPAFIALINRLLGREALGGRGWAGIGLSFVGILLIVASSGTGLRLDGATFLGDMLILAATLCWSLYSVLSVPLLGRYSPLRIAALATAIGAVPLIVMGVPSLLSQNWAQVDRGGWTGLIYSAVFAVVVAYIIWNHGVQKIGGARTAVYNNLTPLVAALTAALFLGEAITPLEIVGAAVIFLGLYLARTGNVVVEPEG